MLDAVDAATWVVLVALDVVLEVAAALADADAFGLALAEAVAGVLGFAVAVLEASGLAEAAGDEDLLEPVSLSPLTFA